MSIGKNFYDKDAPTKNLVTTISGVALSIVTLLVLLGLITTEQGQALTEQLGVVIVAIGEIVAAVAAVILAFKAKD